MSSRSATKQVRRGFGILLLINALCSSDKARRNFALVADAMPT
jgi:hypothetical protein